MGVLLALHVALHGGFAGDAGSTDSPTGMAKDQELVGVVQAPPRGPAVSGFVTHYGVSYQGHRMACGGTYTSSDVTIAAVGNADWASRWNCGSGERPATRLEVQGPAGTLVVTVQDRCPGCAPGQLDLSEAATEYVCGVPSWGASGSCHATIRQVP